MGQGQSNSEHRVPASEPDQVRLIVSRNVDGALHALRAARVPDASLHEARKALKRARAGMRLLREAVGGPAYRRENAALRDAARHLSSVRDAAVVIQTAAQVAGSGAVPAALARLRRTLRSEQRQARAELTQGGLARATDALEAARRRIGRMRLRDESARVLRAGIKRIYGAGRRAFRQADADRGDEKLHELRKQVKYLSAALKVLGEFGAVSPQKLIPHTDAIAESLGDDHDLAVLQAKMADSGPAPLDKALALRLKRRRAALQSRALKQARELYAKKRRAFVAGLQPE